MSAPRSLDEQIAELEARIEDLKARLPAHSVPASMLIELEDLEDALVAALEAALLRSASDQGSRG